MLPKIKRWFPNNGIMLCIFFFIVLSIWWLSMFFRGLHSGHENNAFTLIYPWMSLVGGLIGLITSRHWGGYKSYLGKSIIFFSLGLLLQFFGQASYAYLIYIKSIAVPYPSIGDIGYFGSIIAYIYGVFYLSKVTRSGVSLKRIQNKAVALLIPLLMVWVCYHFFLRGYDFDWTNKMKIFLDFGYPLGQAIYVSLAILILIISRHTLGGVMKKPIMFLVFTLVIQYFCDFMFLYQANQNSWYVGGINDYLYFISYFCMTIAIIYIGNAFNSIKERK